MSEGPGRGPRRSRPRPDGRNRARDRPPAARRPFASLVRVTDSCRFVHVAQPDGPAYGWGSRMHDEMGNAVSSALGQGAILALTELALPDALFVHRFDGRLVEVNRRACESLGYSREELLRLSVVDVDRSFDLASAQELWGSMEPGRSQLVRTSHTRRDGSLFPVEVSFGTVVEDGEPLFVGVARDLTDRMAHEHALRFAQERLLAIEREERVDAARLAAQADHRYQGIIQAMSDGMLLIGPDGRIVAANPAAVRILGVGLDGLLGLAALDTDWGATREDGTPVPLDDLPPLVARRTGQAVHGVVIGIRDPASGARRWVRTSAVPLEDVAGEGTSILTTFVDVTELRGLAGRLAEFNRDFEELLERTTDFVYFKDGDGRFRFCSQAFADMTGRASWRDLVGLRDVDVFPPHVQADGSEPERPYAVGAPQLAGRLARYRRPDGRTGWVETSTWPVADATGAAAGVFGIGRDVTAAHQDGAAMRLAAAVLAHVREGIVILDAAGVVVDVNDAFLRLSGFAREEVVGCDAGALHAASGHDGGDAGLGEALRTGGAWAGEVRSLRKSGAPYSAKLTVTPVAGDPGAIQHLVCVYSGATALVDAGRAGAGGTAGSTAAAGETSPAGA